MKSKEEKFGCYWLVLGCNDLGVGIIIGSNIVRNKYFKFVGSMKEFLFLVFEVKWMIGELEVNILFKFYFSDLNNYEGLDGFFVDIELLVEWLVL